MAAGGMHRDLHDSVKIRAQDTSTEYRHRVAEIANGMPGYWLKKVSKLGTRIECGVDIL